MNKIFLIGNLTRDPEAGSTPNNVSFCRFSLAVNRGYKNADGSTTTDFFDITVWRGLADTVMKFCSKGSKVMVEGMLEIQEWTDKSGAKHSKPVINADSVEFLSSRTKEEKMEYQATRQVPVKKPVSQVTPANIENAMRPMTARQPAREFDELTDEDIPF